MEESPCSLGGGVDSSNHQGIVFFSTWSVFTCLLTQIFLSLPYFAGFASSYTIHERPRVTCTICIPKCCTLHSLTSVVHPKYIFASRERMGGRWVCATACPPDCARG